MNKYNLLRGIWMAGLVMLAAQVPVGCDSGTGDSPELDNYFANHPFVTDPRAGGSSIVTLSPASAVVDTVGGKAVFAFNGGTAPYTWDVSDPSKGNVAGSGAQGVYTATAIGANNVIAYDREGHAAIATISGSAGGGDSTPLAVGASPSVLAVDEAKAVITATGGIPPYSWTLSSSPKGLLDSSTGASVIYTRTSSGDNAVTVTDSTGIKASVIINQP